VRTVCLEATSIRSSRLGLGTSSLHHLLATSARRQLLEHAWDRGIRYFDTAPLYGHELAERELARFIRWRRREVVVATKFGIKPNELLSRVPALMYGQKFATRIFGTSLAPRPGRDYGARYARERVERSLRVLQTDYIDILYLHEPTLALLAEPAELIAVLCDLQRSGKIREFGLSGSMRECARITHRYPQLGQVWQVDVHAEADEPAGMERRRRGQVTFGHFRGAGPGALGRCLRKAVAMNPGGVILFSTRRPEHVDEVVALLDDS
jgi:aryl-alcohol dehydrogenase-like predicted oxidoreductase